MIRLDDQSSINKLKSIIKNRFGKGLEISRLTDLQSVGPDSDFFFKNKDLVIPIFQDATYLGTAIVPDAKEIDDRNISSISTLVKMTLIPVFYSQYQTLQENNLKAAEASFDEAVDDFGIRQVQHSAESRIVSHVIHLNGIKEIVFKVAHQIHEIDKRWAFLPYENVKNEFNSIEGIKSLGNITVFVENILALTLEEQQLICEYKAVSNMSSSNEPLFIIGSQDELAALSIHPGISSEMLIVMNEQTFEVNRAPLTYSKLKESVEILFFES
ncbi:MAG: hypothetical protein JNL11_13040 [Bdellovibrionaceae bacterium]|nr:hypothetical protein [Pseudobdellovibrionaceae bacterium]